MAFDLVEILRFALTRIYVGIRFHREIEATSSSFKHLPRRHIFCGSNPKIPQVLEAFEKLFSRYRK